MFFNAILIGKILPRTGPQFAFTDDFNDDDEALKRLDKGLDTLNLRRWGLVVSGVLVSNMVRGARRMLASHWSIQPILGADWSTQSDLQPGL